MVSDRVQRYACFTLGHGKRQGAIRVSNLIAQFGVGRCNLLTEPVKYLPLYLLSHQLEDQYKYPGGSQRWHPC